MADKSDAPESEFESVVKRLLSTPPQPHNAPKSDKAKGSKDDNRKPKPERKRRHGKSA